MYNIAFTKNYMIQAKLQQLSNFLIRPQKRSYNQQDLGPNFFKSKHGFCSRKDFTTPFRYFQTYGYPQAGEAHSDLDQQPAINLKCSIFYPNNIGPRNQSKHCLNRQQLIANNRTQSRVCVLAMHGNTGSRMSTLSNLEPVLQLGCMLAIFDFGGCGNSNGEFVTLGYHQKNQISAVLQHIYTNFRCHQFILYGRSMGAASALFYSTDIYPLYVAKKEQRVLQYMKSEIMQKSKQIPDEPINSIKRKIIAQILHKLSNGFFGYEILGMILDSPYYDASKMARSAVKSRAWFLPNFLINYTLDLVQQRAVRRLRESGLLKNNEMNKNQSDSKIKQQSILNEICLPHQALVPFPVYVLYGLQDNVISQTHTWQLFQKLQCQNKKLHILEEQGHGDHRDEKIKLKALEWVLQINIQKAAKRLQLDAKQLGMSVQDLINLSWKIQQQKREAEKQSENIKEEEEKYLVKQKERSTQMQTQRTVSLASLKIVQVRYGSTTSIEQNNFENKQLKQQQLTSIYKHYTISDDKQDLKSSLIQLTRKTEKLLKIQQEDLNENDILIRMSRVSPYNKLKRKLGISVESKLQEKSNSIDMIIQD